MLPASTRYQGGLMSVADRRARFHELHAREGIFLMPNPWDAGSARLLERCGFEALATTSAGYAWLLGKEDHAVTRAELVAHVAELAAAVDVPLSVDSERCFASNPAGVAETVRLLADAGAAGCSIEDWDQENGRIDDPGHATELVAAAVEAAHEVEAPLVLTARAENHLHGVDDLDDTIARLTAFRGVGADCVYAPGLTDPSQIAAVVEAVDAPVNVLALPAAPSVPELAELGVRRVSTGSLLARTAYGAMLAGARELLTAGTSTYAAVGITPEERAAAFGG
jgi:2-methylisocitrate lyase-like PEP mutase family enzyme